jgi:D-glycero-beta-D-manno-heptose-7-phosphate kinase
MATLTRTRARALFQAMRGKRVLVLGDVMLDEFLWGRVRRISPEAPVPVVEIERETFHVGGAGNVARNVRALRGGAVLAGIVGRDAAAMRLREELREAGVEDALVDAPGGRPTTLKTRVMASHQQICRADREDASEIPAALEASLLARSRRALHGADVVVVSDYQKGAVTRAVMRGILAAARRRAIPVLVDPKVRHFSFYRGATVVTPNQLEAEQATGLRLLSDADVRLAGERILKVLGCQAALLTRGEHGMSLFESGRRPVHIAATAREVYDVTGAGDTVIATLALALSAGARLSEAAILANAAAGLVVGKLGTATASADEILAEAFPG